MKKEKIKQMTLICIAVTLIAIGYLNYNLGEREIMEVSANANESNIGDVQLVNTEPVSEENEIQNVARRRHCFQSSHYRNSKYKYSYR